MTSVAASKDGLTPSASMPALGARGGASAVMASALAQSQGAGQPVRWVPHTHANPSHAKFCYMCMHAGLLGKDEHDEKQKTKNAAVEDDIPETAEMRSRGFLHHDRYEKLLADFQKRNLSASFLEGAAEQVFDVHKGMVKELNADLRRGLITQLYPSSEEEGDWVALKRMFELTPGELRRQEELAGLLYDYCHSIEPFKFDEKPGPDPPERDPALTQEHLDALRWEGVLDATKLRGESAAAAQAAIELADASAVETALDSLPAPDLQPSLGGRLAVELEPEAFEHSIPEYEPLQPPPPELMEPPNLGDAFPAPRVFSFSFTEKGMPEFKMDAADEPYVFDALALPLEDLHPHVQGQLATPDALCPPLVESHLLPPVVQRDDLSKDGGKASHTVVRLGLWEPDLPTCNGDFVPPIADRARALDVKLAYDPLDVGEVERHLELKGAARVSDDLLPRLPVKSFARFPVTPKPIEFGGFLLDICKKDYSVQDVLEVIEQRHQVIGEVRKHEEARRQQILREKEQQEAAFLARTVSRSVTVTETEPTEGAPPLQLESTMPHPATAESLAQGSVSPAVGQTLGSSKIGASQPSQVSGMPLLEAPSVAFSATPMAGVTNPPAAHYARLNQQLEEEKQQRNIANVLQNDVFLTKLAQRISDKMGPGGGPMGAGGDARLPGASASGRDAMNPVPVNFLDETQEGASVPGALQGRRGAASAAAVASATKAFLDVNDSTQEKTRGEAFVRLLTEPTLAPFNKAGDIREMHNYVGAVMEPNANLLLPGQFHLSVPKPEVEEGVEDDEVVDEFEDVERSNVIMFSFVRHNRFEAVEQMLQQDAQLVSAIDEHSNTLLHIACQNNHRRIAKLLVRAGARLDAQNDAGNTPLHFCYAYGFVQLAEMLIAAGADVGVVNSQGLSATQGLGYSTEGGAKSAHQSVNEGNPK